MVSTKLDADVDFDLNINTLSGETYPLQVNSATDGITVKQELGEKLNASPLSLRLFVGTSEIYDTDSLSQVLPFLQSGDVVAGSLIRRHPNETEILQKVHAAEHDWRSIEKSLWSDTAVVLALVEQSGHLLRLASDDLKRDRRGVLAACHDAAAIGHAADELKSDRDFVLKVVQKNGWALSYVDARFRSDREVVRLAVEQNGFVLENFAHPALQRDPQLLRTAEAAKRC
mmetsp:Transcript_144442/g.402411  ORF Transcript_144442/g.402411 Transcript_144442/m.402411 type:complete len:229 (-) Transcript_144442:113-799(-)